MLGLLQFAQIIRAGAYENNILRELCNFNLIVQQSTTVDNGVRNPCNHREDNQAMATILEYQKKLEFSQQL